MTKLVILGSSNAIPTADHQNTHFVLSGDAGSILVDCSGNTWVRIAQAGIEHENISDILLTHCHPDHISGIPPFLMNLWLSGRKKLLRIYGLKHTLTCVEKMMALYDWKEWPDFFPVSFNQIPDQKMIPILENTDIRIFSSPVRHIIPTIGLRFESVKSGVVIAYSGDTEPCEEVVSLARDADILIHEATGASYGHSSAAQAGEIAQAAGVRLLYFIHYPPNLYDSGRMIEEARSHFNGDIHFARDLLELSFLDPSPT